MEDDPVALRPLGRDDRGGIAAVLAAIAAFRPEEAAVALEMVDETLHPRPDTDYAWVVAERGGTVVGFACFGPVSMADGTFDLYWIAVHPDHARRGIAARLDDAATAQARAHPGARWLLAETSGTPAYDAARAFYQKRGYALLGRVPDFYRPGDDRLTFGKRLDGD